MIKAGQIAEILSLYKKHGWILRRVLLSDELKKSLGNELETIFGDAEIRSSDVNAAWVSRKSKPEQETWEIRLLSETPFALMEIFDAEDDEEIREETLAEVEERLKTFQK